MLKELDSYVTSKSILCGDFNFPDVNWSNISATSPSGIHFIDFYLRNNLCLKVRESTRGDNILDLCMCTPHTLISECEVREHFSSSDHNTVHFKLDCQKVRTKPKIIRDFSKANFEQLNKSLANINWSNNLSSIYDLNSKYESFGLEIQKMLDLFIPFKRLKLPNFMPDYSSCLRAMISKKATLWRKMRLDKDKYKDQYRSISKAILRATHKARSDYENRVLSKGQKALFRFIGNNTKQDSFIPALLYKNTQIFVDKEKCETFSKVFLESFSKEDKDIQGGAKIPVQANIANLNVQFGVLFT